MNRAFFSRLYGFSLQPAVLQESVEIPDQPASIVISSASILNPEPGETLVSLLAVFTAGTQPVDHFLWTSTLGDLNNATSLTQATLNYRPDIAIGVTITAYYADNSVAATATKQITIVQAVKVANVVTQSPGQSNDGGLSPVTKLPAKYKQTDDRVKIYSKVNNAIEVYQVGVNDLAIPTGPGSGLEQYDNGFGPDAAFVYAWKQDPANKYKELFLFKKGASVVVTTNGATVAYWESTLYPEYKDEWEAYKGLLTDLGYDEIRIKYVFSGLGEGDAFAGTTDNFATAYEALIARIKTDNVFSNDTELRLAEKSLFPAIVIQQEQIVSDGVALELIVTPYETFLFDDLHKSAENMVRTGKLYYKSISGFDDDDKSPNMLTSLAHGVDFFNDGDGVYFSTDLSTNNWTSTLFDKFLAQGSEGGIYVKYDSAISAKSGWIGLMAANTLPTIEPDGVALFKIENGVIVVKRSGTTTITTVPAVSGRYYQICRNDANQLVIKESVNETAWTEIYSFNATSGAKLYTVGAVQGIFAGGDKSTLITPRQIGLT